jgi:hypothetical protein
MNERMLSGAEHTPALVQVPPPTMTSNGVRKVRKVAHVASSREDQVMASTPAVLESRHRTMNDISKALLHVYRIYFCPYMGCIQNLLIYFFCFSVSSIEHH